MLRPPILGNLQMNGRSDTSLNWFPYDPYRSANVTVVMADMVFDFARNYFRSAVSGALDAPTYTESNADTELIYTTNTTQTMVDSDGILKFAPHNLLSNSNPFVNGSVTLVIGETVTVETEGTGDLQVTDGVQIETANLGNAVTMTVVGTTLSLTGNPALLEKVRCYKSYLGGMMPNPDTGTSYVETAGSPVFKPRMGYHKYVDATGTWDNHGLYMESRGATNRITNSISRSGSHGPITITNNEFYTFSFQGNASITLSGANTSTLNAYPLTPGTRYKHTFQAGSTSFSYDVTGTAEYLQLESGNVATSYVPTVGSQATRGPETLTLSGNTSLKLGFDQSVGVLINMIGEFDWRDPQSIDPPFTPDGQSGEIVFYDWYRSGSVYIYSCMDYYGRLHGVYQTSGSGAPVAISSNTFFFNASAVYDRPYQISHSFNTQGTDLHIIRGYRNPSNIFQGRGNTHTFNISSATFTIGRNYMGSIEMLRIFASSGGTQESANDMVANTSTWTGPIQTFWNDGGGGDGGGP